ncbi:MAG: type II toxin-antitoxin system Phd/YefM family antitoxin [Thermodesulfobacteriota bacterium]
MDVITYSHAREHLAATMERVCADKAPIVITRQRAQAVVMMSLEEYNAIEETAHLLRTPANAERLRSAVAAARSGEVAEHALIED